MSVKGKIEATKLAKSGKSLGVKVGDTWYRTKEFRLEHEVGSVIDFDVRTSSLPDGTTLYWIGDYQMVGHSVMPPPKNDLEVQQNRLLRIHDVPSDTDFTPNLALLDFVGRCFAGYSFQTTDEAHIRYRARMLYLMGKDILSGEIEKVETGPRREKKEAPPEAGIPGYQPLGVNATEDDPDDDIPF